MEGSNHSLAKIDSTQHLRGVTQTSAMTCFSRLYIFGGVRCEKGSDQGSGSVEICLLDLLRASAKGRESRRQYSVLRGHFFTTLGEVVKRGGAAALPARAVPTRTLTRSWACLGGIEYLLLVDEMRHATRKRSDPNRQ